MDDEWKDWDVVEAIRSTEIPGFMAPTGGAVTLLEGARQRIQDEWEEFVDLLNTDGPGTGYERLLSLRDNMEERKEELSREVEKWGDREDWLRRLKGAYVNKLQRLADVSNPEALWRTHGVNDPIEQLNCADDLPADQSIAQTFLDFDDDGRLIGEPDLEDGWQAYVANIPIGRSFGELAQEYATDRPEPRVQNMTVRYRLSNGELERAGINPENLESPRSSIRMESSTTWRDALLQIEEREQSVKEEKIRPNQTIKVLDFRLRILENVLYRFETFGSVEKLTDVEARDAARERLPDIFDEGSKPLEYATEIVRKYRRDPSSLPEGRGAMGKFKEGWVPDSSNVEGSNKVSMIFRAMRRAEPNLSDEYSGPESFCDLLERLLERHRES